MKAGTYVNVAFNRKSQVPTLQIPREALVGSIRDARIYVVDQNNVAKLQKITVAADNGNYLEIQEGLQEGDRVVTTGQINLADSTKVSVIQSGAQNGATAQGMGNVPASGGTSSMNQ